MTKQKKTISEQLSEERRRVDFDSYDMSVQQLVSMVGKKQIDVAPTYQRRFRWDELRQSQLVESLLLGIPVPGLFMATNADGTWEVVDGVQRLSTLVRFCGDEEARELLGIKDHLRIDGLEKLTTMNGHSFQQLPPSVQLQFSLRPIKVTTLNDKSDLKVRFDLFERLNTGGVRLTDQEIRGCIYRGRFNDFLEEMATNKDFRKVVLLRPSLESDGTREEHVLRFFAFLHKYNTFEHSVVDFLNDYMAEATRSFDYDVNSKIFTSTFSALAKILPNGIRRRSKSTPVNLFEAIAVGAALALMENGKIKNAGVSKWTQSTDLRDLTTGATNSRRMVVDRIEFAAHKFGVN